MCGICGVYNLGGKPVDPETVRRMRAKLVHRGPDDQGEFFSGPIGLGFTRLSIIDPPGGRQPMAAADGRRQIVFNGEIYNHPELRAELESQGVKFRTRSDTETLLEYFSRHGVSTFKSLSGMFAAGLWDSRERALVLVRDPLGIKPLYYHFDGESLTFSSELRSLMASGLDDSLDGAGLKDYLAYGKVHAPRTVFKDVLKLPPGHWLRLDPEGLRLERYWELPRSKPVRTAVLAESVTGLEERISEAVRGNMLSDVPLGVFLSGGVDSSLIAALMVRHSKNKVRSFSVGFKGAGVSDESAYARTVARHLGTEHHQLMLPADVLSGLDKAIDLLDEPIGDSAILPTYLLSKFARESVKVVLTGEGADELFAGYDRHKAAWVNQGLKRLPSWGRSLAGPFARRMGKGTVFENLPIADARGWAEATASATPEQVGRVLHPDFGDSVRGDPLEWLKDFGAMDQLSDALAFDLRTVLCDSLLMKVDKSTMRASLEARVPFLDKSVVEYAAGLPSSFNIRRFKGKYLLRLVAAKYLPRRIVWRRKHGFIVPWEDWVRSPDNGGIKTLLADPGFRSRRIFDPDALEIFHEELVRGSRDVDAGMFFRIVVFGLWLESMKRERLVGP